MGWECLQQACNCSICRRLRMVVESWVTSVYCFKATNPVCNPVICPCASHPTCPHDGHTITENTRFIHEVSCEQHHSTLTSGDRVPSLLNLVKWAKPRCKNGTKIWNLCWKNMNQPRCWNRPTTPQFFIVFPCPVAPELQEVPQAAATEGVHATSRFIQNDQLGISWVKKHQLIINSSTLIKCINCSLMPMAIW